MYNNVQSIMIGRTIKWSIVLHDVSFLYQTFLVLQLKTHIPYATLTVIMESNIFI